MNEFPETGKISDEFFKESIYPFCGSKRKEVITSPQYGVDVSLVSLPNDFEMALTSDPLSLIPGLGLRESAWLSVHLMANDMATTGRAPMYAQFVLNLPADFPAKSFNEYWQFIHQYCDEMGTAITGGHTGRFEGQNSTVAGGGTMITIAPKGEMLTSKGASEGDVILVTKESALIASSILALSFRETVQNYCGKEVQEKAAGLFYHTSSLEEAVAAAALNKGEEKVVKAMHDVTEGGLLGGIYEMAIASGCGVLVEEDQLPTGDVQRQIGKLFGIDPHYCVGAGSMVIAARESTHKRVQDLLQGKGIKATVVGKFTSKENGLKIIRDGVEQELEHPGTDPYWKAFYDAFAKGLK
jgi:hydrogenase expression/formation protein HypE